ncbi:unnamed protein product [Lampetra planeri]
MGQIEGRRKRGLPGDELAQKHSHLDRDLKEQRFTKMLKSECLYNHIGQGTTALTAHQQQQHQQHQLQHQQQQLAAGISRNLWLNPTVGHSSAVVNSAHPDTNRYAWESQNWLQLFTIALSLLLSRSTHVAMWVGNVGRIA